jgi:hypothetical protein
MEGYKRSEKSNLKKYLLCGVAVTLGLGVGLYFGFWYGRNNVELISKNPEFNATYEKESPEALGTGKASTVWRVKKIGSKDETVYAAKVYKRARE